MRKITMEAVDSFMSARPFKKSNTCVDVLPNVTILVLHGNPIAYRYNDPENTLMVSTCGWDTVTTKDRLNGIPNVRVQHIKGQLYLNGIQWDGGLKEVV